MLRVSIIAALLLAVPATPAIPAVQGAVQEQGKCADTAEKKAKRSMFGSMLGGLASGVLGRAGGVASSLVPVSSIVADELLKLLDCKEQKQAADATNEAIRGGVGTEVKWTSETRQNVPRLDRPATRPASSSSGSIWCRLPDAIRVEYEMNRVT